MIFLVWEGGSKENGPGFSDRLRKGREDGGTEEKDEHVPPHSHAQRLCSMPELVPSSGLDRAARTEGGFFEFFFF